jgi:hypothetical protein
MLHEAPALPICSLRVGTGVGAPAVLLGSKMCGLPRAAGVSPKSSRRPNSAIGSVGGDALISTRKLELACFGDIFVSSFLVLVSFCFCWVSYLA